jgi:hypothetical protein
VLRLQEAVVLQLDRMKPQQLADVVWAFGRMGHNPGPLLDLVAKKVNDAIGNVCVLCGVVCACVSSCVCVEVCVVACLCLSLCVLV